jgi:signal transduction histidine kinase
MHARTIIEGGVYQGTHGACRDLRERERLEADLQRHAAELAASEERAHLARELHDSVTQALFSMTLVTKSIELLLDVDPAQVRGRLSMLADLQADALAEMRALIFELRPASLRTAGLAGALHTHCAALEGRTGLAVELDADELGRLPDEMETTLFRVAQEALNNVVKHAAAQSASVRVAREDGEVVLEVRDDGQGFDNAAVPDGHLGIAGMRARLARLDGTLVLESTPGAGTVVRASVPLADGGDLAVAGTTPSRAHHGGAR